ncbi:MAG: PIG-L family deacetylase [Clostridiales bacterium]|nr:PIG-L family deacetylase [Clostridiales bacterium]
MAALGGLAALAGILWLALFLAVNDMGVPLQGGRRGFERPKAVLGVFAHPDDEIMVAGTLCKWRRQGARVHLLYLTHGEDGPTGGLVDKKDLGPAREKELGEVRKILNADSLTVLGYPDRHLDAVPEETVQAEIKKEIGRCGPDAVICFDATIGLYGHTDHAWAGRCCQSLLAKDPGPVRLQLVMTLPRRMIALAKKASRTFRERYRDEDGLPGANAAVAIRSAGRQKKLAALAHRTQRQVVGDVQPLLPQTPAAIYYRIFSREYFEATELPRAARAAEPSEHGTLR